MSNIAIHTENLGKRYRLGATFDLSRTFREAILEFPRKFMSEAKRKSSVLKQALLNPDYDPETPPGTFWALRDINLEIKHGDVVGIIGRNGAGKSTLLKILSKITSPTKGMARINGRVGSLLEVGTGFHPELSGKENIYLNGSILGMTKAEINKKYDEIVAFAEVEKFLDTPIKKYSSGMQVRLAFAVAAHLEPEILIVDEVLAVGDAAFQKKSLGKMEEVSKEGRTVLFVSHNMGAVQGLCNTGVLLEHGKIVKIGSSQELIQYYLSMGSNNKVRPSVEKYRNYNIRKSPLYIKDIHIKDSKDTIPSIPMNQTPTIVISLIAKQKIKNANITIVFYNAEGFKTDMAFSWDDNYYLNLDEGENEIEFTQRNFLLTPGSYSIGIGINQTLTSIAWDGISYYPIFEIENNNELVYWNNRPWAIHHTQNNLWRLRKI